MENVGKPKVDVREMIDEEGKTKVQPFNLATNNRRNDRIKDIREGKKRESVNLNDGFYRFESTRQAKPTVVREKSPLAMRV